MTRIVIADDSLLVREGIAHVLSDAGFLVVAAWYAAPAAAASSSRRRRARPARR
jgi:CheY-like chemotaxis protein